MKCPQYNLIEDRDFIAALNPRIRGIRDSKKLEIPREKSPNEGPMNANPYGIILLEKQRVRVKFHKITLTPP